MKILAVDDSFTMRSLIKKAITGLGYKDIVLCKSGEKALALLEKEKFDLILLDWHMPGYTGLDFLRIAKNAENTKDIPVIMLTTEKHPLSIEEALGCGAAAYMIKPIEPDHFQEIIKQIFGDS